MKRHQVQATAASIAVLFTSFRAFAQQASVAVGAKGNAAAATPALAAGPAATPEPPPIPPPAADPAPAPANNQAGMALPATANAVTNNSDHDDMVGHVGVGYMGRATIPYGGVNPANGQIPQAPVPVIGVRYWLNPQLGLDLGLGLWIGGTSTDTTATGGATASASGPKPTAFVLHAGVPLALASSKHFSFQIIPEANFGYAKVSQDAAPTKMTGTHFDMGARAGAEIHFGFIGIPQLSLIGSVGLLFQYDAMRVNAPAAAVDHVSTSQWTLGTTVNDSPWNIFVSNVGALYYF